MAKIKVGSKVKLTNPLSHYFTSKSNPAVGTEHECVGKVTMVVKGSETPIRVKWENGSGNSYHEGTLSLFDENIISIGE